MPTFKRVFPDPAEYVCGEFEVRRAGRKGRGVFATRQYLPGELVMEITGQVIMDRSYSSLYCMEFRGGRVLEPHEPGGLVNHSCDPNCELVIPDDSLKLSPYSLALMAIVNIEPNVELTYHYNWPAEVGPIRCRCGTLKCGGYIVTSKDLAKVRRQATKMRPAR